MSFGHSTLKLHSSLLFATSETSGISIYIHVSVFSLMDTYSAKLFLIFQVCNSCTCNSSMAIFTEHSNN